MRTKSRNTGTQELIVDSFAGGGGASLGIEMALGHGPDIAINHDAAAIAMHAANHPDTMHCTEDVWKVSPHTVTKGKAVGLLWASPDCCHFSRAKGAKPVKKEIRSLAWVVIKWAAQVRPEVIILENVREFEDWGPLVEQHECVAMAASQASLKIGAKLGGKTPIVPCGWKGTAKDAKCPRCDSTIKRVVDSNGNPVLIPDPTRKGHSFRRWVGRLKAIGYEVQWRAMNAADYGAPTHRRRLFLVARCDGEPIVWPEPTHGDPKKIGERTLFSEPLQPWLTAASCIDWSIPCPSIFARKKPLAENTLRRIAMGIKRYVLENPKPFIVQVNHGGAEFRGQSGDEPLSTVTGKHGYGLATPGAGAARPAGAAHAMGVVSACIASLAHGGKGTFGDSRSHGADEPVRTVHAGGNNHALVSAFLAKHFGGPRQTSGQKADQPIGTVTTVDHHALVAANLIRFNHDDAGVPIDAPAPTVMASGNHAALVYSFLKQYIPGIFNEPNGISDRTNQAKGDRSSRRRDDLEISRGDKPEKAQADCSSPNGDKSKIRASACLGGPEGSHSAEKGHKPSRRKQDKQPSRQSRVSEPVGEHSSRLQNGIEPSTARTEPGCPQGGKTNETARMHSGSDSERSSDQLDNGSSALQAAAFITKYFGTAIGANLIEPAPTATGKDRFGLVTVQVNGEPYVIVDIGMRMLSPRELARAQGFPDSYILTGSKSNQVARIGNSVVPQMAKVLVEANYKEAKAKRKRKAATA